MISLLDEFSREILFFYFSLFLVISHYVNVPYFQFIILVSRGIEIHLEGKVLGQDAPEIKIQNPLKNLNKNIQGIIKNIKGRLFEISLVVVVIAQKYVLCGSFKT